MEFPVLENRKVKGRDYLLKVKVPLNLAQCIKPGQFAMVQVRKELQFDPLLRRPFGIFNIEGDEVSFLYRVYGRGTELLTKVPEGEKVKILMPLGNYVPETYESYLFIAGGIGIGGLFLAARRFKEKGKRVLVVYGEKDYNNLSALSFLEKYKIETVVYTEDGSYGKRGLVTSELENFRDFTWVACGPVPMLKAVKEKARDLGVKSFLSLDSRMACGVGACLGCVVKTTSGYKRCCVEGPIFDSEEVVL
jgi:dihydroorotate dehydrogenase electron transfer subunit